MSKIVSSNITPDRMVNVSKLENEYDVDADGCWIWNGAKNNAGYGMIGFRWDESSPLYKLNSANKPVGMMTVHRAAFMMHNKREVTEGLDVVHKCHKRLCINPDCLYEATHKENLGKMAEDGHKIGRVLPEYSRIVTDPDGINWVRNATLQEIMEKFDFGKVKATNFRNRLRWYQKQEVEWPERHLHTRNHGSGKTKAK